MNRFAYCDTGMQTIIQIDYERLAQLAAVVNRQGDAISTLRSRLARAAQPLLSDGWQGRGREAFANGYRDVAAALERLESVLGEAAQLIGNDVPQRYRAAEEEAAAPFQGHFAGSPGAAAAAGIGTTAAGAIQVSRDPRGLPAHLALNEHSTMADLYRLNANQYDAPAGQVEQAVRVFTDDNGQYLISIMGTDNDYPFSAAWWDSNLASGFGRTSPYSQQVLNYIKNLNLPPGATLHLVGHSQGGHVSNLLAHDPELAERYQIGSVTTFGSYSNTQYSEKVGKEKYHNLITDDDWMDSADKSAKYFQNKFFAADQQGKFIQNRIINHQSGGHSGYGDAAALQQTASPFIMKSFRQVSALEAPHHAVNSRWEKSEPLIKDGLKGFLRDPELFMSGTRLRILDAVTN